MKVCINPPQLPTPSGDYSQVVLKGSMFFISGMVGKNQKGEIVGTDIESQTRQALGNMKLAVESIGASMDDVCQVTSFLTNISKDFLVYDSIYREYFPQNPPARATVEVGQLGTLIEIQAMGILGE